MAWQCLMEDTSTFLLSLMELSIMVERFVTTQQQVSQQHQVGQLMIQGTSLDFLQNDTVEQYLMEDTSTLFLTLIITDTMAECSAMIQWQASPQHQIGQPTMQETPL